MQPDEAKNLIRCDALTQAQAGATWADLGCGSGLFSYALAGLLPEGSTVYAIDRETAFDPDRQRVPDRIRPMLYDFVKDDMPLQDLDGILIANALHYVKDKAALLDKLRHYLRADGHILVVEYDTDIPVPVWVPHPVSFPALSTLSRSRDFSGIKKLRERPSLYGRGPMYAALISL